MNHCLIKSMFIVAASCCITLHAAAPANFADYDRIIRAANPALVRQAKEKLDHDYYYQQRIHAGCLDLQKILIQAPNFVTFMQGPEFKTFMQDPTFVTLLSLAGLQIPMPTAQPIVATESTPTTPLRSVLRSQSHAATQDRPETARKPLRVPQPKNSKNNAAHSDWDTIPEHQNPNITKAVGLQVLTREPGGKKKQD